MEILTGHVFFMYCINGDINAVENDVNIFLEIISMCLYGKCFCITIMAELSHLARTR